MYMSLSNLNTLDAYLFLSRRLNFCLIFWLWCGSELLPLRMSPSVMEPVIHMRLSNILFKIRKKFNCKNFKYNTSQFFRIVEMHCPNTKLIFFINPCLSLWLNSSLFQIFIFNFSLFQLFFQSYHAMPICCKLYSILFSLIHWFACPSDSFLTRVFTVW